MTSRPTVTVLVAAALMLGAACSERPGIDSAGAAGGATTTTIAVVDAVLTGLPVSPGVADRPAVTVKVDNAPAARPQSGLEAADLVFEERVEGGITRFLAVYQSQDVDLVGPIRSIRGSDVGVVSMLGGVFTFSSGPGHVVRLLRGHPVTAVSELDGADPFIYPPGRRRPLMTFGATARLREEARPTPSSSPGSSSSWPRKRSSRRPRSRPRASTSSSVVAAAGSRGTRPPAGGCARPTGGRTSSTTARGSRPRT